MANKATLPAVLVNSYVSALLSVSEGVGVAVNFLKPEIVTGVKTSGSKAAAFIGIVGGPSHCTVALMVDEISFASYVEAFTSGMVKPDPNDSMSMSVLGEMTNMVSGRALTLAEMPGLDITPPQLFSGDNIKLSPTVKARVNSFTLPFDVGSGRIYLVLSVY